MTIPEWLSTWAIGVKSSRCDRPQRQWHPFVPIQMEWNKGIPPAGYVKTVDSWLILQFRSWKYFSLGWWNALASAWFPDVRHFENLTPWIQLRLGLRDHAWKPTNGHSRKLAQLSMTIFRSFDRGIIILSVFMAPDRVVLHASRNKSHREVVDLFSRGGRDCHFANTSVEMAKFVRAAVQLRRQCFINPWIQTAIFLIIVIAATSAAISWQFAGWISLIPPRLYSTAVNKVWCLQCGQMF